MGGLTGYRRAHVGAATLAAWASAAKESAHHESADMTVRRFAIAAVLLAPLAAMGFFSLVRVIA